jgi:hypothetical protein
MSIAEMLLFLSVRPRLSKYKKNVLCLSRPVFEGDIRALKANPGAYNFVEFKFYWRRLYPLRRDPWYRGLEQTSFFTGEAETALNFAGHTSTVDRALGKLLSEGLISAFMTANYNYYQDEVFLQLSRKHNIPFFVLLKEHPYSEKLKDIRSERLRESPFPDRGHVGLFAGENSKIFTEAGVFGARNTFFTGFPRHELLAHPSKRSRSPKTVLLIDFYHGNLYPKHEFFPIVEMLIARKKRTGEPFSIKCKDAGTAKLMRDEVRQRFGSLRISVSSKPIDSEIPRASAVILADSTVIYDVLLSETPVYFLHPGNGLIEIHPNPDSGVFSFSTPEELEKKLELRWSPVSIKQVMAARETILSASFDTSPPAASAKIRRVLDLISERRLKNIG